MLFPNLANIEGKVANLLNERAGNNRKVSGYQPWLRIASAYNGGLILESVPNTSSFADIYGNNQNRSGRVGVNFNGDNVYSYQRKTRVVSKSVLGGFGRVQVTEDYNQSVSERPNRPSPIIEGMSLNFGTGGLTRKTNFSIKCFTLQQAETLQTYFAEPGFTVLVEYGWNTDKALKQKASLDKCEMARYNNYLHVKRKEEASEYQYSGYLGFITNSSLANSEGESYILDIELTTIGEIPAFLQTHKGGTIEGEESKTLSGTKFDEGTIEDAAEDGEIGLSLFMQMYNKLPQEKQIVYVKNLHKEGVDSRGNPWIHEGNFVNMDDKIREELSESLTNANIETSKNDSSAKIPKGVNVFSNHSFIRLELAFEILNQYRIKLTPKNSEECQNVKTFSYIINTDNTLCRGFKHMFSTDGSKLLIPNRNHPEFDLLKALTSKEASESYLEKNKDGSPKTILNLDQWPQAEDYCFPQVKPLNEYEWGDGVISQDFKAHTYGYLKDLFINFEFFCEVLGRNNVVNKDIYYELLNGISAAVNNYWYFEIEQLPCPSDNNRNGEKKGDQRLEIKELTLCSPDRSLFNDCPSFMSSGVETPFLSSNFNMALPAAMKNSIVGKRNSQTLGLNDDGATDADISYIFASEQDPVLDVLNSFTVENPPEDLEDKPVESPDDPDEDEIRKANFEIFLNFAEVYTNVKDREGDFDVKEETWKKWLTLGIADGANANADAILFVGAWKDRALFNQFSKTGKDAKSSTNILIPIEFEFETFGITGIVTGQLFRIKDLPSKFKDSAFQVVEVSHELGSGLWKTKVKGKLRNFS